MGKRILVVAATGLVLLASTAHAASILYGNQAGVANTIIKFDGDTGTILQTYNLRAGNGRGVVVVGDTMYYTDASSPNVYAYDLATDTDLGIAFTVAGATGLATMAFDGTNFYIGDYSGTNNVYKYSPTGTLLDTIPLSLCSSFCDGLEFIALDGGKLVSNRFDGGFGGPNTYDIYNLDGSVFNDAFLTQDNGTGIAFDGTFFYVSDIHGNRVGKYDSTGAFLSYVDYSTTGHVVEDLSADYDIVLPPPDDSGGTGGGSNGGEVPEPASMLLVGTGLFGLAQRRFRR